VVWTMGFLNSAVSSTRYRRRFRTLGCGYGMARSSNADGGYDEGDEP
jgi:hypothetical protein